MPKLPSGANHWWLLVTVAVTSQLISLDVANIEEVVHLCSISMALILVMRWYLMLEGECAQGRLTKSASSASGCFTRWTTWTKATGDILRLIQPVLKIMYTCLTMAQYPIYQYFLIQGTWNVYDVA